MSEQFFTQLAGVHEFSQIMYDAHYAPAPDDWMVVLTDVQGSTDAIGRGQYKQVNLLGAACITAVLKCCPNLDIPYVFGGDGATLLVPRSHVDGVLYALLALRELAEKTMGLRLRVGAVSIQDIRAEHKQVLVAKYIMETGCVLAMMKGGGITLAENWIKQGDARHYQPASHAPDVAPAVDLSSISCRWQPIKARHGVMLTLLVKMASDTQKADAYAQIQQMIQRIAGASSNPAHPDSLRYKWPARGLKEERKLIYRHKSWLSANVFLYGFSLFFYVLNRFNIRIGDFKPEAYVEAMIHNCDYQKFDDMLRMVIDCSPHAADDIEAALHQLHSQKEIVYGTHRSDHALMTCFVQSINDDGHVHFIDGDNGGYAMAAIGLKKQWHDITKSQ